MNWYKGDIAQAVAESRQKNAIFVVYVAGKDTNTERLTTMINEEKIRSQLESENFVAIRIESDSQSYMQFASIYQVVPVPSIFFIGKSGEPIEIGTSVLQSVDELEQKIQKVVNSRTLSASSSASTSFITAEKMATDGKQSTSKEKVSPSDKESSIEKENNSNSESNDTAAVPVPKPIENADHQDIVCENGVCYKKPKETSPIKEEKKDESDEKKGTENDESSDLNARLETTRKLLEQKRRERIEEEKLAEKEREIRRRREGREMQHLQEWQREQELKELKENIRRERMEEQAARERIRAQIAADRAERAQKFAVPTIDPSATTEQAPKPPTQPTDKTDTVRLQFRLSNGEVHAHTFKPSASISVVRDYVSSALLASTGATDFVLATAYPRHEFTAEDEAKTLVDLGLFPSAVILVITKAGSTPTAIIARSGGIVNIMSSLFWTMLAPIFSVFNYLRGVISGRNGGGVGVGVGSTDGAVKRANEDAQTNNEASKRRNLDRFMTGPSTSRETDKFQSHNDQNDQNNDPKPYRRYGSSNVHRLSDKRKDSDDENATWNGNSTQQQ